MVNLTRIYTRTGDDGTTSLGDMSRTSKTDPRLVAYADVDETNSAIGVVLATARDTVAPDVVQLLQRVQNDLFDVGADLCNPLTDAAPKYPPLRVTEEYVDDLEGACDQFNAQLDPLRSFILPGGAPAAAWLHLARTVSRRAERHMVALSKAEGEVVSAAALEYINRLSDFLFVAGRHVNDGGKADILWVPGKNR